MAAPAGGAVLDAAMQQLLQLLLQVQANNSSNISSRCSSSSRRPSRSCARSTPTSRRRNHHALDGVAYTVAPMDGGGPPPNWPAGGMNRAWLLGVNALLGDYGQPAAGTRIERRNRLAEHFGVVSLWGRVGLHGRRSEGARQCVVWPGVWTTALLSARAGGLRSRLSPQPHSSRAAGRQRAPTPRLAS